MKNIKFVLFGMLLGMGVFFSMSFIDGDEKAPKGSVGYALGVLIGTDLKAKGFSSENINAEELAKGLKDVLIGNPMMDMNTAQQIFQQESTKISEIAKVKSAEEGKKFFEANAKKPGVKTTASGLQYQVLRDADGAKPSLQDKVKVHYHGTLTNGTVFDSSVDRGEPISFPLNGVIQGWQEGLQLMPKGSKYRLYIPASLGYGDRPAGKIPANSILIFDVELIGINE
jgi:FKBP-type peptidyl-prolyl cis-trans isomerase FklB